MRQYENHSDCRATITNRLTSKAKDTLHKSYARPYIYIAKRGGNKRTFDVRETVNGIIYILGTGCQRTILWLNRRRRLAKDWNA